MKKERHRCSAEEKVKILRRHLVDRIVLSDLCDEYGFHPTVFYRWQKTFFENGAASFEKEAGSKTRKLEAKILAQAAKLAQKDEVIAEIMQSHVALKKSLGED